jgi:phage-related holin
MVQFLVKFDRILNHENSIMELRFVFHFVSNLISIVANHSQTNYKL